MLPYIVADVFTAAPLEGNQLGVFTDARGLSPAQMQRLAREMNFAECVFLLPARSGGDAWVRIFTPAQELPFAGHPVLGAAFVVAEKSDATSVRLETGNGIVTLQLRREGGRVVYGTMEQPIPSVEPFTRTAELLAALHVSRSRLPVESYRNGPTHLYVALESEEAVAAVRPDLAALAALGTFGVSCFAGAGRRWKTRMFAPGLGVSEDPATGSAAGPLAAHLARHGEIPFGEQIEIRQGAEIGRPSVLFARAEGTREQLRRVEVGGSAVIVARGQFERH
jgi:trans-2,3-dihydro-3-hydroxyanthranilate isomerase